MSDPRKRAAFHLKTQAALRRHNDAQKQRDEQRLRTTVSDHAIDCEWQIDQYEQDCTCKGENARTYREVWNEEKGTFTYETESDAGLAPRPLERRFYHHYKGGLYYVHGIGIHTETEEELVMYQHVGGKFYARPMSSWRQKASVNRPPPIHRSQMYVERFRLLPEDFKMVP